MARHQTAARRYAEAAFELGRSSGSLEAWERDLHELRDLLANHEVRAVAEHPAIPYATKERVLERLAGDRVAAGPIRLVLLMIRRGRPKAIDAMVTHFAALMRRERGIVLAQVRTALPLTDGERTDIEGHLHDLTGRAIELTEEVDPSLIGGVAVRIGDELYDASVRSRLERLRSRMTAV